MVRACGKSASVGGLIVFGTTTSLFAKIVYELDSIGKDGQTKYFHKPWMMTSVMFLGMSFCLPMAYFQERAAKKKKASEQDAEVPLLSEQGEGQGHPQRSEFVQTLMLSIPTVFDLIATILMNVGLLYVTASVYQMMRGAEMLFAALFAVVFLKRKLNKYHLMGICCCVVGISLVGSSSILSGEGSATQVISTSKMLFGMSLIIISQAVQAAQLTFEDFFMADLNIPAMKIVGYEGFFGTIMTLGIMMPIAYFLPGVEGEGFHEDFTDTWAMIRNSSALQVILLTDMAALLLYNVSGMMVTGHLGAVFRTVLETMRTLFVWLVDLLLFYTPLGLGKLGESWSIYSWLQAAGFVVLVSGTLVYRKGDEESYRQELAEAIAEQAAAEQQPQAATGGLQPAISYNAPTGPVAVARPVAAPVSRAMDIQPLSSSFRATQAIDSSLYSKAGSLPKSLTRSVGRGTVMYMPHHSSDDEE